MEVVWRVVEKNLPVDGHVYQAFDSTVVKHFLLDRCDVEHGVESKSSVILSALDLFEDLA